MRRDSAVMEYVYSRAVCVRRLASLELLVQKLVQLFRLDIRGILDWDCPTLGDDLLCGVGSLDLPEAIVLQQTEYATTSMTACNSPSTSSRPVRPQPSARRVRCRTSCGSADGWAVARR